MQRIWEFRDSSALLSHCYLRMGREDRRAAGVGRRERDDLGSHRRQQEKWEGVSRWIPSGGALLFPNFARDPGAVIIVTAAGRKVLWLPRLGRSRLMELQRGGAEPTELGGWLKVYSVQGKKFEDWTRAVDSIGETLYKEMWAPVIDALPALGVRVGAELVLFSQGGSGVFPMHAAWCADNNTRKWLLDEYAIRYAPSIKALAAGARQESKSGKNLLVVNPLGDLKFAELESACVLQQTGTADTQVFRGGEATKATVLAALGAARRVHLATHAEFNLERPLDSHLWLAGPEKLHPRRIAAAPDRQGSGAGGPLRMRDCGLTGDNDSRRVPGISRCSSARRCQNRLGDPMACR